MPSRKKIITTFLATLLLFSFVHAEENFSEMSTQELIAIIGFVKESQKTKFEAELKQRIPLMNKDEKKKYEENLKKKKKD
ncbi:DUF1104 domain-containing protein [Sulfurimonas sp.]